MWYAYTTRPNQERKAAKSILGADEGFDARVPLETVKRKRANSLRRHDVEVPIFRGYVFVQVPCELGWWHILHLPEIRGVVGIAGEAMPIDADWIESMSQGEKVANSRLNFSPGTAVEVIGGPAEGHRAKVVECNGEFANVYFAGSSFAARVRLDMLEKV